ncbi:TetR/AcrR family transcriptional regulator [Actinacidiphila acididurans]|uniref:TetR/AcrR family transcriptional regulator n=1 Tax=Actinacidiphila acididurans TaxID=2784346 RepID=A0ABS2U1Z8_9ACTN|nr:TetR/AcrR family transcriptional regulator [Actinacidiphila acididurans]MBM9509077.1 TetR/AcrR family transcriptional regulator [Actinacidiphila acididurans]
MPRIWSETIAAHRDAVREAAIDATASLVARHGPTGVTMSQVAKESGIGRATLYKYFPDLASILAAWHERHITAHLDRLAEVAEATAPPDRLAAVLDAYAHLSRAHATPDPAALVLHQAPHATRAAARLHDFLTALLTEAAARGEVRADIPPTDLAAFCLHALPAGATLPPPTSVTLTLAALRPGP